MDWDMKPYQSLVFMGVQLKPAFYNVSVEKRERFILFLGFFIVLYKFEDKCF